MGYNIKSVIEVNGEGCPMDDQKTIIESDSNGDLKESKSDESSSSPHGGHYHRSEAQSNRHGMFHNVRVRHGGINQNVKVNVRVEPDKDDPVTGCFKAIFKCIK